MLIHAYNTPALEKGRPGAKAAVVVNSSGRAGRRWMREEQAATAVLTRGFDEVRVLLTTGPGSAEELTRNALQSGVDVVFAVGGDGTLNEVVNGFFTEDKLDILVRACSLSRQRQVHQWESTNAAVPPCADEKHRYDIIPLA